MGRRRLIVIGGGFAGAFAASKLSRKLPRDEWEVVLLDRNNYLLFYPLLPEVAAGTLEPRHVAVPLRSFLPKGDFRMANVLSVSLEDRTVRFQVGDAPEESLAYDQLVLAAGSVTRMPDTPGVREHGFELKGIVDAVLLRDRGIRMLEFANAASDPEERRRLLRTVVVGANYTGVELAGEYQDFLYHASKAYPNIRREDLQVVVVEYGPRILPAMDEDLSEYARKALERRGVRVLVNTTVESMDEREVRLTNGETVPANTLVWCAGIAPSPLLDAIPGLPRNPQGYVATERDLSVAGLDGVWAIGDLASVADPKGRPYGPTAQNATRQAEALTANVLRKLSGAKTEPFVYGGSGALAALGCRTAVAKVFGLRLSGFPAWFLYRTAYLAKMPTFGRKVRVVLDWTADLFFRQEPVQMGLGVRKRS